MNEQKNINLIPSGAVSLAASANLSAIHMDIPSSVSIQLVFTGTPAGAFKLQISNDASDAKNSAPSNWTDVDSSSQTISAAGNHVYDYECRAEWVRVAWTASGAGTAPSLTVARAKLKEV
jgi:hypothetical protein